MTATATRTAKPERSHRFSPLLDRDPLGFEAGDANLTRYVGNGPTSRIDPTGLEEESPTGPAAAQKGGDAVNQTPNPIIQIFVDQNTAPPNFNASAVQALMQQMLATAGVGIQLSVSMTTVAPAQLNLGTISYPGSYFYNQPWYGWIYPPQYLVNLAHDCLYYPFAYQALSYTHYVHFSNTTGLNAIAHTGSNNQTTINPQSIAQNLNNPNANMSVLYANIVAHEALYLGAQGNVDDPFAEPGSLASNAASSQQMMTLSEEEAEDLADEMDAPYTPPDDE